MGLLTELGMGVRNQPVPFIAPGSTVKKQGHLLIVFALHAAVQGTGVSSKLAILPANFGAPWPFFFFLVTT